MAYLLVNIGVGIHDEDQAGIGSVLEAGGQKAAGSSPPLDVVVVRRVVIGGLSIRAV